MALFNFGKKKEEPQAPECCCGTAQTGTEEAGCCCGGEKADGIHSIKVLGAGCKTCHEQYENARAAVAALGLPVEVAYVTDLQKVMAYGVMSMPALVVNEKVVSAGKLLKASDVEALLRGLGC